MEHDGLGSLERAREGLYAPKRAASTARPGLDTEESRDLPHAWDERAALRAYRPGQHTRVAGIFFAGAFLFFLLALAVSGYFLYFGGNSVSVNNVDIALQGPTTIAGGDTLPLSLAITNRNSVPIENATIEVDFPDGTRSAENVLTNYPRYTENLGTIAPGATITRSVKAVIFGGNGQSLSLPIALSYSIAGSNSVFVKKSSYALGISTTPLSVSVEGPTEGVSGQPITLKLVARSNAATSLPNVAIAAELPNGFTLASSSLALQGSLFPVGTLAAGASRTLVVSGTLSGVSGAPQVFHFTIGTTGGTNASALAVSYMQQDATVLLTAPFISTTLSLNGDTSGSSVVTPGARQSVTLSYTNTLDTAVSDAVVEVTLSGAAIDYSSIQTSNGFYQSATHSIVFSRDTDPSLASLAPGASGLGTFTFQTLPASSAVRDPLIVLSTSVSGTRVGQTNVPEQVTASSVATAKVSSSLSLNATTLHSSGSIRNTGPVPPTPGTATTYSIVWTIRGGGNAVAGASVSATLPSYVTYTGLTSGSGFSYDASSRVVSWNAGDLSAGSSAQGAFQVSLTPSTSQEGSDPALTTAPALTAFDRYAQVSVTASASPSTTEMPADPGYSPTEASVH